MVEGTKRGRNMLNRIKVNTGLGHIDLFLIKVDVHPKRPNKPGV